MRLFLGVAFFIAAICALPEFRKVRVYHKDMYADEDILIDADQNYAITTVSHINGSGTPSINLHDTQSGYTAIKDVSGGKCYIQQTNHTMQEIRDAVQRILQNAENESLDEYYWTCQNQPIPKGMLNALFGEKIASFCQDYESRFVTRNSVTHNARAVRSANARFWCVVCVVFPNMQFTESLAAC